MNHLLTQSEFLLELTSILITVYLLYCVFLYRLLHIQKSNMLTIPNPSKNVLLQLLLFHSYPRHPPPHIHFLSLCCGWIHGRIHTGEKECGLDFKSGWVHNPITFYITYRTKIRNRDLGLWRQDLLFHWRWDNYDSCRISDFLNSAQSKNRYHI